MCRAWGLWVAVITWLFHLMGSNRKDSSQCVSGLWKAPAFKNEAKKNCWRRKGPLLLTLRRISSLTGASNASLQLRCNWHREWWCVDVRVGDSYGNDLVATQRMLKGWPNSILPSHVSPYIKVLNKKKRLCTIWERWGLTWDSTFLCVFLYLRVSTVTSQELPTFIYMSMQLSCTEKILPWTHIKKVWPAGQGGCSFPSTLLWEGHICTTVFSSAT